MDTSTLLSSTIAQFSGGAFGTIAVLTFFLCEAIFAALPIERARMKQLTSVLIGAVLGLLLSDMTTLVDGIIQGLLAGGATTIAVAKFKKPSVATAPEVPAQVAAPQSEPEVALAYNNSGSATTLPPADHL